MQSLMQEFLTLWVVIDPIGTIPVFIAVTAAVQPKQRFGIALRATLIATGVLMTFLVAGQFVIAGMGISLPSFQIAGGIVLFLFALTMIFSESKVEAETESINAARHRTLAVFPLAIPSLASPGAMLAVVLLTDNNRFSIPEQAMTAVVMLAVLGVAFALMLLATPILRVIGEGGAAIISRVMGMILASVAVNNVIEAIFELIANHPELQPQM